MEKHRYFCELPGDIWEDGRFMDLVQMAQPFRNADDRCPQDRLLLDSQCHCELVMVDPTNQCASISSHFSVCGQRPQVLPHYTGRSSW